MCVGPGTATVSGSSTPPDRWMARSTSSSVRPAQKERGMALNKSPLYDIYKNIIVNIVIVHIFLVTFTDIVNK